MSKFFLSAFLISLTFVLASGEGVKIEVVLDNGDRLSGTLVEESDSALVLQTDYVGEVTLPLARISEQLRRLEPIVVASVGGVGDGAAADGQEEEEPVDTESEVGFFSGFLASLADLQEGMIPLPEWEKNLQFGLNSTSGRKDQSSLNYRLDMQRSLEESLLNLKAEYSYSEANGATTVDRIYTNLRWRKDISPGVFYESQSAYSSDAIKLIDSNLEQKLGLGTRLIEKDHSTLSAGLGASGRWRELAGEDAQEVAYLVDLFQDWDYQMTERIRLRQDFKFAMPLEETDGYEINFSAAVTSAVTEALNLSIRYEIGFDNSLADNLKEDRRFVSAVGYTF